MTVVLLKILKSYFVKQNHMLELKTKHVTINHTLPIDHVSMKGSCHGTKRTRVTAHLYP